MDVKNITESDVDGNYSDHDPVLFSLRVATKIERKRFKLPRNDEGGAERGFHRH